MESIDSRNLILPSPPRVERHSLVHFRPFWEGRNLFFHISPRCNASQRTRSYVARTPYSNSPRQILHGGQPQCLRFCSPPYFENRFSTSGWKIWAAAEQRIPTANMELQFLLLGSKWIREFCFIILLKTREIYLLTMIKDENGISCARMMKSCRFLFFPVFLVNLCPSLLSEFVNLYK